MSLITQQDAALPESVTERMHRARLSTTRIGALRIGDAEREATCQLLGRHYAAGRLTSMELDERVARAVHALTEDELIELTADLPRLVAVPIHPAAAPAPVRSATNPTQVVRVLVEVGALGITALAALCTLLVLLGAPAGAMAGWVAFGTAVTCLGSVHFIGMLHRELAKPLRGSSRQAVATAMQQHEG